MLYTLHPLSLLCIVCSNGQAEPEQLLSPLDRAREALDADAIDKTLMVSSTQAAAGGNVVC